MAFLQVWLAHKTSPPLDLRHMLPVQLLLALPGGHRLRAGLSHRRRWAVGARDGSAEAAAHFTCSLSDPRIKALVRSTKSVHANAQASVKRACVCNACHYPRDAFSPSVTFGSILTFVSCCRAPAAKWAQRQLPACGRGIGSGAISVRCHLPDFQVTNRPGQWDLLIWLLYLTASQAPLRKYNNAKKA